MQAVDRQRAERLGKRDPAAPAPTPKPPKVGSLPKPPKPPKPKATQAGVSMTSVTMKSEPTAILDAARVDAEVERRLAEIEGAREGLKKAEPKKSATPIAKSESDHVKEFVLGLDLGGTRRWHSACVSKDDSNLGKAIKGKQADRTYSREGSRGVPGICTGCGGELQMDPAPREVDAPVHGEDHNEHKIEKAEPKMKMPKYTEGRGWTGGEKDRLYHLTDKRTGQKWVKDIGNMRGTGPEVEVRHATRAEAEEMHQKPLHPGWKVSESVEKGYDDEVSKEWVHGHLRELSQHADEHQKAGRKADADAMREKIKVIKEKHGVGPAPLGKNYAESKGKAAHLASEQASDKEGHQKAANLHWQAADAFQNEGNAAMALEHSKKMKHHADLASGMTAKSELLAGARHHYARVVRFQQLGKSEEVTKSAAMCALYVAKMGADPSKDVPAEVRNCGPVDLQKAGFHLDREVRGLPAKMLPLIKAHPAGGWSIATGEPIHSQNQAPEAKLTIGQPREKVRTFGGWYQHTPVHDESGKEIGVFQTRRRGGRTETSTSHHATSSGVLGHNFDWLKRQHAGSIVQKALTGAPGDTALGATMDGGALQMSEDSGNYKGFRIEKFSGHSARPATLAGLGRGEGTGGFRKEKGFLIHLPDGGTKLVPTIKHARQYIDNYGDIQKSKKDGGALQMAEDAKHGAKEVCAECKQPISYHQHSRKWNHSNTQDSEKPHQSVRVRPEGWSSAWHKSVEKSEKSDVIGEVGKSGGKPLDIGDGYHVHAHGFDANGNHSVWVSKGSGRARKIQSGQNLPSVHSQRGAGEKKGHLPITKKIAEEIKDYHRKYHEKPVKKAEPCAPAGSPLEKLNAMIKGTGGASRS